MIYGTDFAATARSLPPIDAVAFAQNWLQGHRPYTS